jgi:adenylate cyclase
MHTADLLAEAEVRAERLAGLVRIVVAIVVSAVFAVAIVWFSGLLDDPAFAHEVTAAAITLVAYLGLGVLSVALARPGRFRPWMPWAFTLCDIGFLFANLSLMVVNFGLPSEDFTSFPPIWLSPLILAVATLRYNPYLVAATIAVITVGLVAFVLGVAPAPGPVAPGRDTLQLIVGGPPNAMRIAILTAAGAVLAVGAVRARGLLRRAIDETVKRDNLTRYLPRQVADWLADTGLDEARAGRQMDAAVLFCDIRGFTERAEGMEPAALGRFVNGFREAVTRAAEATGGVIDKFVGDSAMIVFGVPAPGTDDARNALDCAHAILANVAGWNLERAASGEDSVQVGAGAYWGRVFCGAVGDLARLEFTVLGDTVNVAARLEEETKRAGLPLVVSRALLDAAGDDPARWTELTAHTLRGRHGAVQLYGAAA